MARRNAITQTGDESALSSIDWETGCTRPPFWLGDLVWVAAAALVIIAVLA